MRPNLLIFGFTILFCVKAALLSLQPYLGGSYPNLGMISNFPSVNNKPYSSPVVNQNGNIYNTINTLLDQYSKLP